MAYKFKYSDACLSISIKLKPAQLRGQVLDDEAIAFYLNAAAHQIEEFAAGASNILMTEANYEDEEEV